MHLIDMFLNNFCWNINISCILIIVSLDWLLYGEKTLFFKNADKNTKNAIFSITAIQIPSTISLGPAICFLGMYVVFILQCHLSALIQRSSTTSWNPFYVSVWVSLGIHTLFIACLPWILCNLGACTAI